MGNQEHAAGTEGVRTVDEQHAVEAGGAIAATDAGAAAGYDDAVIVRPAPPQRPLIVRAVRKVARLARNFVRDPRRFVRSVVRRRVSPRVTRVFSFLVRHSVVPSVRDERQVPATSIVALLGGGAVPAVLTTAFEHDTELVLLVDGRHRARIAEWLSQVRARSCRLYVFERRQPQDEMLRYGLSRAYGKRLALLGPGDGPAPRALAGALAKLPDDDGAFADHGDVLVLRQHAARALCDGRGIPDGLASALRRIGTTAGDGAHAGDDAGADARTGVFFITRRHRERVVDRLLVWGDALDRKVVYGPDPQPLLDLLALQGDEAAAGVEVVDTRRMAGHFVYRAAPPTALFAEPAECGGIVCFERKPSWFRVVTEQVRAAAERVTVIMTVYNDAATLAGAADSILQQTHRNLELIIVDDGSSDGSLEVARRKAVHDRRVRVLQTPANSGTYVAKNLGLAHATGDLVTFQDADDISLPHRIEYQVAALHSDPASSANLVRYQRLSEDTGQVLWVAGRKDRPCAVTLMFRRQVLDTIGFFDSVRVTADSELMARLGAATGRAPRTLPLVGYLARHARGSLTTSGAGEIVLSPEGAATLPPARVAYWEAAQRWHHEIAEGTASPYLAFPLRSRPFPAPEEITPGSWADAGATVTASMATMPERVELLARSVGSLLPQVDRLRVYLNNFDEVPAVLDDPRITVLRSQDSGDLKDNGKFFAAEQIPDGYHFTVDDDIAYPPDYVQKSILKIEQYERRVAVGVHGVNLADPLVRYTRNRRVAHFKRALERDELVHLLGTGTLAYHTSTLRVAFDEFRSTGVADLWFAIQARRQGVALLAQARPDGWLQPLDHEGERIFDLAQQDDERETAIAHEHGPWTADAMAAIWRPLARDVADRRPVAALTDMGYDANQLALVGGREPVRFTLVVPGWNCAEQVEACWKSIQRQRPGHYVREVYFVDDASTDGTWDALTALDVDDDVHLVRHDVNHGPAHARYTVLSQLTDPDRVCVLLDLDDQLTPDALWRLAEVYLADERVWMTCGSWRDQRGRRDALDFYDESVLRARAYRDLPLFKCTHLRSFRRFLFDPLGPEHFQDPAGDGWLMHCSDVALLLPLLEQCAPENIVHIHDILYRYLRHRETGTLQRFGKDRKRATFRGLCALPRLPARADGAMTDGATPAATPVA